MTTHLIPIAPAPPRTPVKIGDATTLTSLKSLSPAARCVLLPLQSDGTISAEDVAKLSSELEMQNSAKRLQGLQLIGGPASTTYSTGGSGKACKRKIDFGGLSYTLPKPQSSAVVRRNERERNRVRKVNVGFAKLRDHVPNQGKSKKLSKVETLKGAVEYIRQLRQMLKETDPEKTSSPSSSSSSTTSPSFSGPEDTAAASRLQDCGSVGSVTSSTWSTTSSVMSSDAHSVTCGSPTPSLDTFSHTSDSFSPEGCPPSPSSAGPFSPDEGEFFDFTAWFNIQS